MPVFPFVKRLASILSGVFEQQKFKTPKKIEKIAKNPLFSRVFAIFFCYNP